MILLNQKELNRIIFVIGCSLNTLVQSGQADQSRLLLFIMVFGYDGHNVKPDEVRVRRQAHDLLLHVFQYGNALRVIQASNDAQS